MSDLQYRGIVYTNDEPLDEYLCKWLGWFILMICFICILIKLSGINECSIDKIKDNFQPNRSYLEFWV